MRSAPMTHSPGRGASNTTRRTRASGWTAWLTALSCLVPTVCPEEANAHADKRKRECLAAYADAQEQRLRGALLASREQLLMCSRDDCPAPIIHDCSEWLGQVERDLSSVVFAVSDEAGRDLPSARVLINGQPLAEHAEGRAQPLDPGAYQYSVEMNGYERAEGTIVMRQSEKNRIVRVQLTKPRVIDLNPTPPPAAEPSDSGGFHVPVSAIVLGTTALVGVAGFTYFGLNGQSKRDAAERCTMDCGPLIDAGKRDYIIADISLGVAVAAAGTALLITLLDQAAPQPKAARDAQARTGAPPGRLQLRF